MRSGRLAIGGGASSSNSELAAWDAKLLYECGAQSGSVGVVLLGLELDTLLNDEPSLTKNKFFQKPIYPKSTIILLTEQQTM